MKHLFKSETQKYKRKKMFKKIISILIFAIISQNSFSDCSNLNTKDFLKKEYGDIEVFFEENQFHILAYPIDSCTLKGCEITVFTKINLKCKEISLTKIGHYTKESLSSVSLEIRYQGETKLYLYSHAKKKFQ